MTQKYTADFLEKLPTLAVGQSDDLKIDDGKTRIWLSRCGIADGMPYEKSISVEKLIAGTWQQVKIFEGCSFKNLWAGNGIGVGG